MDWKIIATTFVTVFLAELGDKTQIATLAFSMESDSKWGIFIASAAALTLSSFLAVFLGSYVSNWISPQILTRISGVIFIILGAFLLFNK